MKNPLTGEKVPCIPPIFHDSKSITDFRKKAELFNSFFANKCSLITDTSVLPTNCESLINKTLSNISFTDNDIGKIVKCLDPNKAQVHDMMSILMVKICGYSIYKPLHLTFRASLDQGTFPLFWKKANVVPIYKKNGQQSIKNYRPVSFLPICGKIFERLLYNEIFSFFIENGLISQKQSGFKPGDSCINQLLSITHEIYKSFDDGWEVRGVFLDISKAFDKVWHQGVLFKLKQSGISGNLLKIMEDFLANRYQRVVLNGQAPKWTAVNAGIPQGSILGPLLLLIYINNLFTGLSSNSRLFADDTSLFSVVRDMTSSANILNNDLLKINNWAYQWKMSFNPDPSKQSQEVIFSRKVKKPSHPNLTSNNNKVIQTPYQEHLNPLGYSQTSKFITETITSYYLQIFH